MSSSPVAAVHPSSSVSASRTIVYVQAEDWKNPIVKKT